MPVCRRITVLFLLAAPIALPAQDVAKLARLCTATSGPDVVMRQYFGRMVARKTVDLAFQVGGQIVDFPIIEDNVIPKGALVAGRDRALFRLSLDQAVLQQQQAERTLRRLRQLQGNVVAQTSVGDAKAALNLAEIAMRRAERDVRGARLPAPCASRAATRSVANFSTVHAGQTIARLHNMSEVRMEIDAPKSCSNRSDAPPMSRSGPNFRPRPPGLRSTRARVQRRDRRYRPDADHHLRHAATRRGAGAAPTRSFMSNPTS